jgi:hypothetical protein
VSGHIALHRDAFEHPLLKDGDRFRAWFWMVSRACWKATRYDVGGKTVMLTRGQFCCSVRELAEAWDWSKSAVDRFLSRLKTETMIGTDAGTGKLVITICNYDKYQQIPKEAGTADGTLTGTPAGQQRDIKEEGNNSVSNETGVPPVDTVKAIFELGITLLTASGQTDRASRSIVGRWRKDYSDSRVLEALVDCQNRRISNPVEWMPRRLSASGAQAPGSDLASLLEQSSRYRKQAA